MSGGFIQSVSIQNVNNDQVNFSNGVTPVSIANLDLNPNQLLFSVDGSNISGLSVGDGLSQNGVAVSTVGNSNIQLVSNSIYVNDNINTISSGIASASAADTVYVSSGSYNEEIVVNNKSNISIISPSSNNGTICEALNGLSITGTSETIRLSNINIKGSTATIRGVGRHRFNNVGFSGSAATTLAVNIGQTVSQFMTFLDCEWNQYCNIVIHPTLASVVYFINCNFAQASITCSQSLPVQVIFNNCSGLDNLAGSNFTKAGLNVSGTDIDMNVTNAYVAGGGSLNFGALSKIYLDTDDGGVGNVVQSNGASGLIWAPAGGYNSYWNVFFDNGQQTVKSDTTITLYEKLDQANILPSKRMLFNCIFNFSNTTSNPVLTFSLIRITGGPDETLQSFTQSLSRTGHHSIPINFDWIMTGDYTLSFKITVTSNNGATISTDTNDYYSVKVDELQDGA